MTPDSKQRQEPHPKQYMITEDQISDIENHGWIDVFMTLEKVRTQPITHSAAPVPDKMECPDPCDDSSHCGHCVPHIFTESCREKCTLTGSVCNPVRLSQSEHNALVAQQAKQQERERVLPLVEKSEQSLLVLFRNCWDGGTIDLVKKSIADVRVIKESLRQSKGGEHP